MMQFKTREDASPPAGESAWLDKAEEVLINSKHQKGVILRNRRTYTTTTHPPL
ncbi:MAG: hypothetical protein U5K71_15285 [Gracilimonas sp.]|nr:hypothetical protein [Gracilimonas sp.]